MSRKNTLQINQKGISLVEILLAIAALSMLAFLVSSLPNSLSSINKSRHSSIAREIASKQIDLLRKKPYADLVNGTTYITTNEAPELSSLPSPIATYEIDDCLPEICTNSEDIKQIRVLITWKESGENETVELTTLVANGGLGK